jgi:multiple sugar transport system substrate-binding protein
MKKFLSITLMAILATGLVFANGQSEKSSSNSDDGVVTIKYAFWGNPDAIGVEQDIIDAFEESHPTIKVEPIVSGYSDYNSKIMTMIAGGMSPDVMRIDSYNFADFTALNAVENLDPYIERDGFDLSIYPVASIEEATVNGNVYALPWATAPLYMLVNLNAFEKAGIDLPSYDWTFDDFFNIIEEFNGKESGCYGYATQCDQVSSFLPLMWADGGNLLSDDLNTYTLDQPNAYTQIQRLADEYQAGNLPKDMITADGDTLSRWFTNNTIALYPSSAMGILAIQNVEGSRFEAYPMPNGSTVKNTTVYKSNEICISVDSKEKDAAWEFMKFLRGNSGETLYIQARRIPPMLLNDATLWDQFLTPGKYPQNIQTATEQIATIYGHKLPLRKGYSEIETALTPVFQSIMIGKVSAKEGFTQIEPKIQEIITRNNK